LQNELLAACMYVDFPVAQMLQQQQQQQIMSDTVFLVSPTLHVCKHTPGL
jgi:hypothetical protein